MRRWVVPMLAAVTSFAVLGGLGVSPASAADLVSADGTTVITEVVLPPLPAGSSQPATLAATVSYGGSACTPCSVHFYVGGLGWAQDEYQYLSNGGSGRFTATALPSSVGQYPVQVVLYGADGMPKETVGIGTLLVGQVIDGLTISPVTASATHVLPGATVTVGADVLVPSGTGTLIPGADGNSVHGGVPGPVLAVECRRHCRHRR